MLGRFITAIAALRDPLQHVFPAAYIPNPELNEIYELKLGMLEAILLSEKELIERGAYFISINGKPTYHYHLCTGGGLKLPTHSNIRLQSFLGILEKLAVQMAEMSTVSSDQQVRLRLHCRGKNGHFSGSLCSVAHAIRSGSASATADNNGTKPNFFWCRMQMMSPAMALVHVLDSSEK